MAKKIDLLVEINVVDFLEWLKKYAPEVSGNATLNRLQYEPGAETIRLQVKPIKNILPTI